MTVALLLAFAPNSHASTVGLSIESGGFGVASPADLGPLELPGRPDFIPPPGFGLPGRPNGDYPGPQGMVNGTDATNTEFRAVVNFVSFAYGGGYPFCSGTLIDDEWVLTAAHCIDGQISDINRGNIWVYFSHNIYQPNENVDEAIEVVEGILHPAWDDRQLIGDLALVRLASSPVSATPMVVNDEPINNSWMGDDLTFVGFGVTSDNAQDSGLKRWSTIAPYYYDSWVVYSHDNQQNVCFGDSGGAALEVTPEGYELAGVNSFVFPGCVGGDNGAARVDGEIGWIESYANIATDPNDVDDPDPDPDPDPETGDDDDDDDGPGVDPSEGLDGEEDVVVFDNGLDDPVRPEKGTLPTGVACQSVPAPMGALFALVGLLGLRRRR